MLNLSQPMETPNTHQSQATVGLGSTASLGSFFLFYGTAYYPFGGFADFKSAHETLEAATQAAEAAFEEPSTDWAEVIDVRTAKRVYGRGYSCYFDYEKPSA